MIYLGDFNPGDTVRFLWNSNSSVGASITRATNGTISVYQNLNTTQSTSGVTDTEDFDGLTGVHAVAIDTSADGTFYAAGRDFMVVLSGATIDGQTVNAVIGHFSIQNRNYLRPTTAGRTLDVSAGGEAGVDWANVGGATTTLNLSGTTVKTATDVETDTADIQSRIGTPSNLGGGASLAANLSDIEAQTDDIGAAGVGLTAIPWNSDWDTEVQSEVTDALNAYDPPTNAELVSEINAVQADIAALNDLSAAQVNAEVDTALTDYDAPTRAELTSDINSVLAVLQGLVLTQGTIGDTGNDTTHLHLEGLTYGNDEINNYLLVIYDVSEDEYHARWIEDFVAATDLATVATLPFTPANDTDTYSLLPIRQDVTGGSGLDAAGVRAAIGLASANLDTQLETIDGNVDAILVDTGTTLDGKLDTIDSNVDSILADTNELQTDWVNGGRLDLILDARASQTSVDTIDNNVDAILVDTGTTLQAELDGIQADTEDIQSKIGTPAGASLAADIADVEGKVDDLETRIGTPSDLGGGATVAANLADIEAQTDDIPTAGAIADAVWDEDATGHQTQGTFGQAIGDPVADTDTIWGLVNTNLNATVSSRATQTSVDTIDDLLDSEVAAILEDTGTTIPAQISALNNLSSAQAQTAAAAALTAYDPPTNAEMEARTLAAASYATASGVSAVETDTQDIQSRLPAALTGAGNMKSDALALNGSATAAARLALSAATIVNGTAQTGTLSTTQMTTNLTEATNDHFNGRLITWTSGALVDQQSDITDYDGATKMLTFTAVTEAPANGDTFVIT